MSLCSYPMTRTSFSISALLFLIVLVFSLQSCDSKQKSEGTSRSPKQAEETKAAIPSEDAEIMESTASANTTVTQTPDIVAKSSETDAAGSASSISFLAFQPNQSAAGERGTELQYQLKLAKDTVGTEYKCVPSCPEGLILDEKNGMVKWTPAINQFGNIPLKFKATSGGETAETTVNFTVAKGFTGKVSLNMFLGNFGYPTFSHVEDSLGNIYLVEYGAEIKTTTYVSFIKKINKLGIKVWSKVLDDYPFMIYLDETEQPVVLSNNLQNKSLIHQKFNREGGLLQNVKFGTGVNKISFKKSKDLIVIGSIADFPPIATRVFKYDDEELQLTAINSNGIVVSSRTFADVPGRKGFFLGAQNEIYMHSATGAIDPYNQTSSILSDLKISRLNENGGILWMRDISLPFTQQFFFNYSFVLPAKRLIVNFVSNDFAKNIGISLSAINLSPVDGSLIAPGLVANEAGTSYPPLPSGFSDPKVDGMPFYQIISPNSLSLDLVSRSAQGVALNTKNIPLTEGERLFSYSTAPDGSLRVIVLRTSGEPIFKEFFLMKFDNKLTQY